MKFTDTIEELKYLIKGYQKEIEDGFTRDDLPLGKEGIEWTKKAITNMGCAIEVLKNNESDEED